MRRCLMGLALVLGGCSSPDAPAPTPPVVSPPPVVVARPPVIPTPPPVEMQKVTLRFRGRSVDYLEALPRYELMSIVYHRGGYIYLQKQALEVHNRDGQWARVTGECISACTLLFSIGGKFTWTCDSTMGFHSASVTNAKGDRILNKGATLDALTYYPGTLQMKLGEDGAMDTIKVTRYKGWQISNIVDIPCVKGS